MVLKRTLSRLFIVALLALGFLSQINVAAQPAACDTGSEACLASCKRFGERDVRLVACTNFCRKQSPACEAMSSVAAPVAVPTAQPEAESVSQAETEAESQPDIEAQAASETQSDDQSDTKAESQESDSQVESETPALVESVPQAEPDTVAETSSEASASATTAQPIVALTSKKAMLLAQERNAAMLEAIRLGELKSIRRLIEVRGLHPTYVYAYNYNPQTRLYEGKVARLRLTDIFNDANTFHDDDEASDRMLALFMELGMDVKATMLTTIGTPTGPKQVARTAWGPNLKLMETGRDRDARMRAAEMAFQNGLVPNDDFSEWLFAELPQVCGRDKSKFAIQVFDLLIKYHGPLVKENLWRAGARGPETVADVLDLSFAPPQAKYEFQKAQFAQQDLVWENCALLSRRINRFLISGN
jgi:hypothetical protein